MKAIKLFYIAVLICMSVSYANAQWDPTVRMTNADGYSLTSFSHQNNIGVNGSNVHMVYSDQRDATPPYDPNSAYSVYYRSSTDDGSTFGTEQNLSAGVNPSVAVNGSVIHVVFEKKKENADVREIYYIRSNDNGSKWSAVAKITEGASPISALPSVAVNGNYVHVSFFDNSYGNYEISYMRSVDGGNSWSARTRISTSSGMTYRPCISTFGSNVYIVYLDSASGNWGVYLSKSINNGQSFSSSSQINSKPNKNTTGINIQNPSLAVSGNNLTVFFSQISAGLSRLRYITSTNAGGKWSGELQLTTSSNLNMIYSPSLSASGSVVHLTYALGAGYIYYNKSINNGSSWGTPTSLTPQGFHTRPSISTNGNTVHVIYFNNQHYLPPPDSLTNIEIWYSRNLNGGNRPVVNNNELDNMEISYSLMQNYPNPFNPATKITYQIPKSSFVKLSIYDITGRLIKTLINELKEQGAHSVTFNGSELSSGTYFYKIEAGQFTEIKRMVLVK